MSTATATPTSPTTGSLTIEKVLCGALGVNACASGARNSALAGYAVTFSVVGPGGYARVATLTLEDASGSATLTGLEPGSYTVCEIAVATKGAHQVPLTVAEAGGCQVVTVAASTIARVTFHDAVRTGPTPTPTPAARMPTVTTLPATGAGGSPPISTGHRLLIGAAGALILTGLVTMRRPRRRS